MRRGQILLYAARRSGLRGLRAQASRAPCAQANEPRLRPRQDLVVGYMGAPFDADKDEMQTAALMVTVRNERGRAMLDEAVRRGRVEVLLDGGRGGAALPSTGDRSKLAFATFERDSIVKSLTDASFVAADAGAPSWVGDILAKFIAKTLPTGLEFARYSIDYHFLRNQLFCEERMGKARADRHVPRFASAVQAPYAKQYRAMREGGGGGGAPLGDVGAQVRAWTEFFREALLL